MGDFPNLTESETHPEPRSTLLDSKYRVPSTAQPQHPDYGDYPFYQRNQSLPSRWACSKHRTTPGRPHSPSVSPAGPRHFIWACETSPPVGISPRLQTPQVCRVRVNQRLRQADL